MESLKESGGELRSGKEKRIFVSVRLRPMSEKEISDDEVSDWECINEDTIVYKNISLLASERAMYPTANTFDRVFGCDCSTREVYDEGAKDVIMSVVRGINSTVFSYGQTASGKTYTMTGITTYAIEDIFEYVRKHPEREFRLKFSAMEIYNESIRDLLSTDSTPLRLIDDPERGTIVENLTEAILRNRNHATLLLSICQAQRQVGEMTCNERNSRAHQIIRLTIESSSRGFSDRDNASTLAATVNFVDLAGSEQASQSSSAAKMLKEGSHIDCSLLNLETIIRKLSSRQNRHVSYRDFKLTWILQTSLEGNARAAFICTISPGRSHVEQSRSTLNFASCAKGVTTDPKVNVVISDKALVMHLQREVERLQSNLRTDQSSFAPSIYSAILREKEDQIEKLEKEIKDLILQRDIAQSQVKELLCVLGDKASPFAQVGPGNYPHLRVRNSPDLQICGKETSVLADTHSFDFDTGRGQSGRVSGDQFFRVPYVNENFVCSNPSQRTFETCQGIRCIEEEEIRNVEANYLYSEDYIGAPTVRVRVNGELRDMESASSASFHDDSYMSSPLNDDNEVKEHETSGIAPSNGGQEFIPASAMEDTESITLLLKNKKDFSSLQFLAITSLKNPLQYLGITSLENPSLAHWLAKDSSGSGNLRFSRGKISQARFITNSISPWLTMKHYSGFTPSFGSEKNSEGFGRKMNALKSGSDVERFAREDCPPPPESALDIKINNPVSNPSADKDGGLTSTLELRGKAELSTEQEIAAKPDYVVMSKVNEHLKKDVEDVGADPVDAESKVIMSRPVEFKRLQTEIFELWHACNVSLIHRTHFFLLFQGDPSDATYLEVERRRLKFLKEKLSRGEKTIVNGRSLTLSSSKKALHHERQMLSKQMLKKFTEKERERLFQEWGISLNTKMRRQQLAELVWTKTNDLKHVAASSVLVAKLVGVIEPGLSLDKAMFGFGQDLTPKRALGVSTFKRSLISIL